MNQAKDYARDEYGELLHRRICRERNGAYPKHWHVHHVDGDKANNVPANLIALEPLAHWVIHTAFDKKKLPARHECEEINNRLRFNTAKFFREIYSDGSTPKGKPKRQKQRRLSKKARKAKARQERRVLRERNRVDKKSPCFLVKKKAGPVIRYDLTPEEYKHYEAMIK